MSKSDWSSLNDIEKRTLYRKSKISSGNRVFVNAGKRIFSKKDIWKEKKIMNFSFFYPYLKTNLF